MSNLVSRLRDNFRAARQDESGDIVQTLLIIALFVIIVVFVGNLIYRAVRDKANATATCIAGANPVSGNGQTNC